MKKLVTLTASALLMASFATAASAAETTPTTTPATTTTPTAPATVVSTTPSDVTATFTSSNNGFSFAIPAYWDANVKNTQYNADQLKAMNESGVYLVNFTYTPEAAAPNGSKDPVKFASIRGYESQVWASITNKAALGTPLNTTGNIIYVLEPVTANPFSSLADQQKFSQLLQGVANGVKTGFTTDVKPVVPGNPTTPTTPTVPSTTTPGGPVVIANDPAKISENPTPTINLTSMTPFYKAPGGTMIGYLGPQKLDTTGNGKTDPASGQWVEIYTWMGLAWIVVE